MTNASNTMEQNALIVKYAWIYVRMKQLKYIQWSKSMFYINVKELMHRLLPKPQHKLDSDRAESLDELPIIKIRCDLNAIEGIYNKF